MGATSRHYFDDNEGYDLSSEEERYSSTEEFCAFCDRVLDDLDDYFTCFECKNEYHVDCCDYVQECSECFENICDDHCRGNHTNECLICKKKHCRKCQKDENCEIGNCYRCGGKDICILCRELIKKEKLFVVGDELKKKKSARSYSHYNGDQTETSLKKKQKTKK